MNPEALYQLCGATQNCFYQAQSINELCNGLYDSNRKLVNFRRTFSPLIGTIFVGLR